MQSFLSYTRETIIDGDAFTGESLVPEPDSFFIVFEKAARSFTGERLAVINGVLMKCGDFHR